MTSTPHLPRPATWTPDQRCVPVVLRQGSRSRTANVSEPAVRYGGGVELEITDEARALLDKRGGTMTIDFIRPTG